MKARVNQELCIGCGMCEGTCPEVFRLGDSGVAEAYGELNDGNMADVEVAVSGCPVGAISLED